MDKLHHMLSAIRTETKSAKDHLRVFREFLAHLDQARRPPPAKPPRPKPPRRRRAKPLRSG